MSVDWFTLVAQVLNFLVLVWLLNRLFYQRIIGAMDAREAGIAARLEEAAQARAAADEEAGQYRASRRELEQQRSQILERAREEAEARRQELLDEARLQADHAREQWLLGLEREREDMLQEFRERVGQGVLAVAGKGLKELADADLEAQALKAFSRQLRGMDPELREAITATLRESGDVAEVHTTFMLDGDAREEVAALLRRELGNDIALRFATSPELVCGIELRAGSHRLAWSVDAWLETLEERIFDALDGSAASRAAQR